GIRDLYVTGVQTCALPISAAVIGRSGGEEFLIATLSPTAEVAPFATRICETIAGVPVPVTASVGTVCASLVGHPYDDGHAHQLRSEERRVGKEWRSRW